MNILEVAEGGKQQSPNEKIAYSVTTTNWASSPSSPSVKAYDETTGNTDVTTTVYPTNNPSISGDVISLSKLRNLTRGHLYRIDVLFTAGGNTLECSFKIQCE